MFSLFKFKLYWWDTQLFTFHFLLTLNQTQSLALFLKALMENFLHLQAWWEQLQSNNRRTLMNGIREPSCFTQTVTDQEKGNWASLECWRHLHPAGRRISWPTSFSFFSLLRNFTDRKREWLLSYHLPFFFADISQSGCQWVIRTGCPVHLGETLAKLGVHLHKLTLQMNQVESMRGAQAFKGRNPSRETVSRAGTFFREQLAVIHIVY